MAIVQDAFFISEDIETGLATGLYRRNGSVVRYARGPQKGQIVKHLNSVNRKATGQLHNIWVKAPQLVRQHKKGIITVAGIGLVVGLAAYNKVKNRELKVLTEFRESLRVYIDAIRNGNMDLDKINDLMNCLRSLKAHKDYAEISIKLTTEELEVLVGRIYEYTIKLAKDNSVELSDAELGRLGNDNVDTIINLETYLSAQKRIFLEVS